MTGIVGVVGLGIMGSAFMQNLRKAGFDVVGFDVAPAAMDRLASAGGLAASSPREVAERAPIVFTSLASYDAVRAVIDGADGLSKAKAAGQVVIECGTLPIELKQWAHDTLARVGMTVLDCPVSGTGAQAARKDLVVFGSGDKAAWDRCQAALDGMSRAQKYVGAFGNGSKMKFIANHLVTIHNVAAAEALVLGARSGLDPQMVFDALGDSAGSSRMFQVRGPLMIAGNYSPPTARVNLHLKDLSIISAFAEGLHCPTPLYSAAEQLYFTAANQGHGDDDTASVYAVLQRMAGTDREA